MTKETRNFLSLAIKAYKSVITKAENRWAALHPQSFKGYALCKNGLDLYLTQFNLYIQTYTKFKTGSNLSTFDRKELNIFRTFPSTMIKSTPIVILSVLPGSMLLLPFLFLYPRKLLTENFWTDEQKSKFFQQDLFHRQQYFDKVEHDFTKQIHKLQHSKHIKDEVMTLCTSALSELQNNNAEELISVFESHFNLYSLPLPYMWHLKNCYPIPTNFLLATREKLRKFSTYLAFEDHNLRKENIKHLGKSDLFELCLTRGINPYIHDQHNLVKFLTHWSEMSCKAKVEHHSFRLHLILLISNQFRKNSRSNSL